MEKEKRNVSIGVGERNVLSQSVYPEVDVNLNNFALFLSVMRNKKAYQNTLSIIMEEPDIKIREVNVERVVLNKSGKKAIRLDAWAMTEDDRQFDMEMENDIHKDSIPRRARYYQSTIDTRILKSGKHTKYRELPTTVIIFITQEDIFGMDLTKYTFTEQCEEVADLKLEDGTTKIFLNMTSKNGSPELVSLLQYMKQTTLDNPEILVKDERLLELDAIVTEVKTTEEWEEVSMDLIDYGIEKGKEIGREEGREEGREKGIKALIRVCLEMAVAKEVIVLKLQENFELTTEEAEAYVETYFLKM